MQLRKVRPREVKQVVQSTVDLNPGGQIPKPVITSTTICGAYFLFQASPYSSYPNLSPLSFPPSVFL